MKSFEGYLKLKLGNSYILLAGGEHKAINDFLLRSGGQMTGPLTWSGGTALPERSAVDFIVCIDGFADGGTTKWASIDTLKTSLGLGSNAYTSTAYLPLSGGTLSGNLSFSNSGTEFRGINYGTIGDSDQWRIGGAATESNSGYMEIATADDGTEPIYVRQYTGVFSSLTRTLTLLDESGNTSFPGATTSVGNTTSSGFVKSGSDNNYVLLAGGGEKSLNNFMLVSPYYYPSNMPNENEPSSSYFGTNARYNYVNSFFSEGWPNSWLYANILNWTGYALYGGTLLAVEYCTDTPRIALRTWYYPSDRWGNWIDIITSTNISLLSVASLTTTSKTAWGCTYWTSGGIPTDIPITSVATMPWLYFKRYDNDNKAGYVGRGSSGNNSLQFECYDNSLVSVGNTAITTYWTSSGNVGIGMTDPSYKLDINGLLGINSNGCHAYIGAANYEFFHIETNDRNIYIHPNVLIDGYLSSYDNGIHDLGLSNKYWNHLYCNYINGDNTFVHSGNIANLHVLSAKYISSDYYYDTEIPTSTSHAIDDSRTSGDLYKSSGSTLFPVFLKSEDIWWDTIFYSGYSIYGGTQLATLYNAVNNVRIKVRKYNLDRAGWGDWTEFITSGNIGSLSVLYATKSTYLYSDQSPYRVSDSSPYYAHIGYDINGVGNRWYLRMYPETPRDIAVDYAFTAGSADTVDGYHYNNLPYVERLAWWNVGDSHNVNDLLSGATFAYTTHNAPVDGIIVAFNSTNNTGYQLLLQGLYSGENLYFRNRNGDNGTWQNWRYVIHSGNIGSQSVTAATYLTSPYLYSDSVIYDSTTSESLSRSYNGTLLVAFHNTDWGWSDTLYWSGYDKWGGTELATQYDAGSNVRVKIRKYNQGVGNWGNWTEFITTGNISSQTVANATNCLPLSGGTMTGNINWNTDSHGIYFFGNCGIEKWAGYGPSLVAETGYQFEISSKDNRASRVMIVHTGGGLTIGGNLSATNFYTTSDRSKKQNISSFSLHIRKFQLKDKETWHYGVIAQEVPKMFRDGEEGNMTVNYNSVLSYYIGILENKINLLELKIKYLENK